MVVTMARPLFSVILPTYQHSTLLPFAIESVLEQACREFELLVIVDGADPATLRVCQKFAKQDHRVQFFSFPKGQRNGEVYRDEVLRKHARGKFVAYQSDDDLWFPEHLDVLQKELATADFTHTLAIEFVGEQPVAQICDLSQSEYRQRVLEENYGFGLTTGAHTMSAYLQLPVGWRTTPKGIHTDVYMWRQFLEMQTLCATSILKPTALHFGSPMRKTWSDQQRVTELRKWLEQLRNTSQRAVLKERLNEWLTFRYAETEAVIWRWTAIKRLPKKMLNSLQSLVHVTS
jgi:GalNAc5-diNAcBac-PP-undecaprenol beta-1,3-glucosyltransferase